MLRKSLLGVIAVLLLAGLAVTGCSGGAAKRVKRKKNPGLQNLSS